VTPDSLLTARLAAVCADGWALWERFDLEVRQEGWHPFVAADYDAVLRALQALPVPRTRFLELGSATGVITILADLLGFDAQGIELDPALVELARRLARQHRSKARFVAGSYLPAGYQWRPADGDRRLGTIGEGVSAYRELGRSLDDFDVVFVYPWDGETAMVHDLMRRHGSHEAHLITYSVTDGVVLHRPGYAPSRL
jgi:SAM-dependent methyltransferase